MISPADPGLAAMAGGLAAAAGWQLTSAHQPAQRRLSPRAGRAWRVPARRLSAAASRRTRVTMCLLSAIVATLAAAKSVPLVPVAVACAAGYVVLRRHRAGLRARDAARQRAADVNALRALAAELRSGLSPAAALRVAGTAAGPRSVTGSPGRPALSRGLRSRMLAAAAAEALAGDPAQLLAAGADPGSPAAALATAVRICGRTGARLAGPVSRIADGAAADVRLTRESEAALASARSSARLLAALPLAGIVLGSFSGTGSVRVLLSTGVGQLCLLAGVGLDLAGLAWLDRLAGAGDR